MNAKDIIKSTLSMEQVATYYGFTPNRAGFVSCPFHDEKTASLRVYPNSFNCFGCGTGGDIIKFVQLLFNISFVQAMVRLNCDFGLNLDFQKPDPRQAKEYRRKQAEKLARRLHTESVYKAKSDRFRALWSRYKSTGITQHEKLQMEFLEGWLDRYIGLDFDPYEYREAVKING